MVRAFLRLKLWVVILATRSLGILKDVSPLILILFTRLTPLVQVDNLALLTHVMDFVSPAGRACHAFRWPAHTGHGFRWPYSSCMSWISWSYSRTGKELDWYCSYWPCSHNSVIYIVVSTYTDQQRHSNSIFIATLSLCDVTHVTSRPKRDCAQYTQVSPPGLPLTQTPN